jgi:hypothetical protein
MFHFTKKIIMQKRNFSSHNIPKKDVSILPIYVAGYIGSTTALTAYDTFQSSTPEPLLWASVSFAWPILLPIAIGYAIAEGTVKFTNYIKNL